MAEELKSIVEVRGQQFAKLGVAIHLDRIPVRVLIPDTPHPRAHRHAQNGLDKMSSGEWAAVIDHADEDVGRYTLDVRSRRIALRTSCLAVGFTGSDSSTRETWSFQLSNVGGPTGL